MDCGIIHFFSDRKTYSQYLFIYVPLATCFLKLVLKSAHLVHYILSLEKQTSYEYSNDWQMLPKILPSHHPSQIPFYPQTHVKSSASCRPFLWSEKQNRTQNKRLNYKRVRKVMIRQAYERLGNISGTEQKILLLFLKPSAILVNWLVCFLDWIL